MLILIWRRRSVHISYVFKCSQVKYIVFWKDTVCDRWNRINTAPISFFLTPEETEHTYENLIPPCLCYKAFSHEVTKYHCWTVFTTFPFNSTISLGCIVSVQSISIGQQLRPIFCTAVFCWRCRSKRLRMVSAHLRKTKAVGKRVKKVTFGHLSTRMVWQLLKQRFFYGSMATTVFLRSPHHYGMSSYLFYGNQCL